MPAAPLPASPSEHAAAGPGSELHGEEGSARLRALGDALDVRQPEHAILACLCFAAVVPILYLARAADGNALTSWRWTFSGPGVLRALATLGPALAAAVLAARASCRRRVPGALVAALAGAAILPLWAEPEAILDAARYFVQAKHLEVYGVSWFLREWGRGLDAWTDLPLVPFAYGVVFSAAGASRAAIQALDTVLFAATALLAHRIARTLWDDEAGVHAAALLLAVPFLLVQVPLLLVDVPAMFLVTLFAWAALAAARRGGAPRTLAAALAASAAALAKYSLWPALLLVAAGVVAAAPRRGRALRVALGAAALAAVVVGAAIAARPDVIARQLRLLSTFQWDGLGRWQEGWLSTFAFQTHPLVTALAIAGAARAVRARDARFLAVGLPLAAAFVVGSVRARYAVPLLPFVAIAAGRGAAAVRDLASRRLLTLGAVATSLVVAWGAYLPFLRATSAANLAAAGRLLDALDAPVVEVHALPQPLSSGSTSAALPLLAYATRKRLVCPRAWPRDDEATARTSPLRFSWALRRPAFYAGAAPAGAPVIVVSGEPPPGAPPGLAERARFHAASGVFRYQTLVTVYARDEGS